MPRSRIAGKVRHGALTHAEEWNLLLGAGREIWSSEAERKEAWFEHREELLHSLNAGTRPAAYWDYEQEKIPHESDSQALFRLGLLTEEELKILEPVGEIKPATGQDPRVYLQG